MLVVDSVCCAAFRAIHPLETGRWNVGFCWVLLGEIPVTKQKPGAGAGLVVE